MARRRPSRLERGVALGLFSAFLLAIPYATFVEPIWVDVTYHRVTSNYVQSKLRIVQLSDLHLEAQGSLAHVLDDIESLSPNVVVITGDVFNTKGAADTFVGALPGRVFWVPGNVDLLVEKGVPQKIPGATRLSNEVAKVADGVYLMGLDMDARDPSSLVSKVPPGAFVVALFHEPALYRHVRERADLALAGHTHGGQVRLPAVGALWLPPNVQREDGFEYEMGWYERMYVNRGLGTSIFSWRFMCRPEIAVFDLEGPVVSQ